MHTYRRCCCGIKLVTVKKENQLNTDQKRLSSLSGGDGGGERRTARKNCSALKFSLRTLCMLCSAKGKRKTLASDSAKKSLARLNSKIAKFVKSNHLLLMCARRTFESADFEVDGPVCIFENRHARRSYGSCAKFSHTLNRIFGCFTFLFDSLLQIDCDHVYTENLSQRRCRT